MAHYLSSNTKQTKPDPIYTDIDPSMSMHPKTEDLVVVEDTKSVRRSIMNLLSTAYGERLFQPNIGSSLRAILFEPIDPITTLEVRDRIMTTIRNHEPRVDNLIVDVISLPDANSYQVNIEFSVGTKRETDRVTTVLERIR
ncbi:MAG: hypothetical protein EB127_06115 [Alphaproteobacteria bacterium]|nr:hypothetical protein [Alphaproteobacteria bacterium]